MSLAPRRHFSWAARRTVHVLAAWEAIQVELHGQFSATRLLRVNTYVANTALWRALLVILISPLPCLGLIVLIDAIPLAPPEDGMAANYAFFIRAWGAVCFVDYNVVLIIGESLPQLGMQWWHPFMIGVVAGCCSMVIALPLVSATFFPFPFSFLVVSLPSITVIFASFAHFWGSRLRTDGALRRDMVRYVHVFACQVALTYIYPIFISIFETLDAHAQTFFVMLLPAIKIIGKNWVSYALGDQYDAKPEAVIFNVEVFHALYVSTAMQSSASMRTTIVLMLVDLVQCWISVRDVAVALQNVRLLLRRIPEDHPFANKSVLQVALQLLVDEERQKRRTASAVSTKPRKLLLSKPLKAQVLGSEVVAWRPKLKRVALKLPGRLDCTINTSLKRNGKTSRMKVVPTPCTNSLQPELPQIEHPNPKSSGSRLPTASRENLPSSLVNLDTIFSSDERMTFIKETARALFIVEYVVLVEYTEVVVPFIYSMYLIAIFHMPNCAHYPSLTALDHTQRVATVTNILVYAGLELLSLILTSVILKRMLGMPLVHQLAFVLDTQKTLVQSKLMMWIVYIQQVSLAHMGGDFTLQFAWLHNST